MSSRSSRHSLHRRKSSRASINSIGSIGIQGQSSGLGNLADELEQAWEEDIDPEQQGSSFLDELREGESAVHAANAQSPCDINDMHDFGFINSSVHSPLPKEDHQTLQIPASPQRQKSRPHKRQSAHHRTESAYDGSDYGSDHDEDEISAFPTLLRKRIREIEKLARDAHDTDDALSEGGGVIKRTINSLRDLGPPQSNIEYGLTKLVTAYTSMSTHRTHKQREIFALSHSLLYSNASADLPSDFLDLLTTDLDALTTTIPFHSPHTQNPLLSLQILAAQTSDLTYNLRSLTDLLQESKLAVTAATRKLKSVREMVEDMRVEEELVEQSILLIQGQDWDRRCRERQAGRRCREIARGFGERWGIDVPVTVVGKGKG
jgi:hypothetical protein